jgi:hypothetical protein
VTREVAVEHESRVDADSAHDLEARAVDERHRTLCGEECREGGSVHGDVDPRHTTSTGARRSVSSVGAASGPRRSNECGAFDRGVATVAAVLGTAR